MPTIETVVRQINSELAPQFEDKLRAYLTQQDRDWLIEQIVRLTLDKQSLEEMDRKHNLEQENNKRAKRADRVRKINLGAKRLKVFIARYDKITRSMLISENYLKKDAPSKGEETITAEFRTPEGEKLLQYAKDMLFALLFGDDELNVELDRTHREVITLTLPRNKSEALSFIHGTRQDPGDTLVNMLVDNVSIEMEYGETDDEMIGNGIAASLKLINNLEINEEVIQGRTTDIEQSVQIT